MNQFKRTIPKFSIIVPSWFKPEMNGKYGENETYWFATECLKKFIARTPKEFYELIIIDNGSTLTNKHLTQELPLLEWYWSHANILIRNKTNLGFAPAMNQAFNLARGKYIIAMNNDIIVWPGWVDALLEPFENPEIKLDPPPGVVMPALMKETGDAREALKVEKIDLTSNAGKFGQKAEFGSCWIMPKKIMNELKAKDGYVFDENFRLGMGEDRDLWDRVRLLGYGTYRTHNTRVFHQGNMSIGKFPDRKKYTFANREYLAKKREQRIKKQ